MLHVRPPSSVHQLNQRFCDLDSHDPWKKNQKNDFEQTYIIHRNWPINILIYRIHVWYIYLHFTITKCGYNIPVPWILLGIYTPNRYFIWFQTPGRAHLDNGISRSYPFFRMLLVPPGPEKTRWPDDESEVD